MTLLLILLAALAVWPIYAFVSRSVSGRRHIRIALLVIFLGQVLATVLLASQRFRHDPGRFEDDMFGLVFLSLISLVVSVLVVAVGETELFLTRRRREPRDG